ncbi:hypothetical protein OOK41_30035 [Micromonospora sp. NBC_01655]|uniref:hypothetical protein n=1 Tax=Micromonospora sp. NBC_01655 TaxID=2975983 RepID=UPI0022564E66|nr:hypothetical protein [Micromonospora sp. NBC_01655]MCX4474499.1 hypothetical protein [Micromonospora sp. NBC_01655]
MDNPHAARRSARKPGQEELEPLAAGAFDGPPEDDDPDEPDVPDDPLDELVELAEPPDVLDDEPESPPEDDSDLAGLPASPLAGSDPERESVR